MGRRHAIHREHRWSLIGIYIAILPSLFFLSCLTILNWLFCSKLSAGLFKKSKFSWFPVMGWRAWSIGWWRRTMRWGSQSHASFACISTRPWWGCMVWSRTCCLMRTLHCRETFVRDENPSLYRGTLDRYYIKPYYSIGLDAKTGISGFRLWIVKESLGTGSIL